MSVPWRATVQGIARLVKTRFNNTTLKKSYPLTPRRCTSAARTSEGSQEFYCRILHAQHAQPTTAAEALIALVHQTLPCIDATRVVSALQQQQQQQQQQQCRWRPALRCIRFPSEPSHPACTTCSARTSCRDCMLLAPHTHQLSSYDWTPIRM